jgi:hypothetical protein
VCEYQASTNKGWWLACEHHEMMRAVRQKMSNYRTTGFGLAAIIRLYQHSGCHAHAHHHIDLAKYLTKPCHKIESGLVSSITPRFLQNANNYHERLLLL